jgi:hypothetical protein
LRISLIAMYFEIFLYNKLIGLFSLMPLPSVGGTMFKSTDGAMSSRARAMSNRDGAMLNGAGAMSNRDGAMSYRAGAMSNGDGAMSYRAGAMSKGAGAMVKGARSALPPEAACPMVPVQMEHLFQWYISGTMAGIENFTQCNVFCNISIQ